MPKENEKKRQKTLSNFFLALQNATRTSFSLRNRFSGKLKKKMSESIDSSRNFLLKERKRSKTISSLIHLDRDHSLYEFFGFRSQPQLSRESEVDIESFRPVYKHVDTIEHMPHCIGHWSPDLDETRQQFHRIRVFSNPNEMSSMEDLISASVPLLKAMMIREKSVKFSFLNDESIFSRVFLRFQVHDFKLSIIS